jgi:hypothetical protein
MNALHLLFRTDRFNLSKIGKHFINPCCFGEDLAAWLQGKLRESGVEICEPYQEDWGWELPVRRGAQGYYLCMSGNTDESAANPDKGEWRIIIEKKRSLRQRLTGDGKITRNDEMVALVQQILSREHGMSDVRIEDVERIL